MLHVWQIMCAIHFHSDVRFSCKYSIVLYTYNVTRLCASLIHIGTNRVRFHISHNNQAKYHISSALNRMPLQFSVPPTLFTVSKFSSFIKFKCCLCFITHVRCTAHTRKATCNRIDILCIMLIAIICA